MKAGIAIGMLAARALLDHGPPRGPDPGDAA